MNDNTVEKLRMIYHHNKLRLPRMHQIIVVAGAEAVELNILHGYFLWLRENVCVSYQ